ncbi:MAG TPA: DNA replication and repair protein RecF [Dehalococcoidia bacterium]|nr:DNA replication and repair protein RecF [Dehalococcoidia bacterium]
MKLNHLRLTGFRNYRHLDLALPPGNLLFLGDNAQGKSNLLEAVYLLASGRSARAGNDSELIGWHTEGGDEALEAASDRPFARLEAAVERGEGSVHLETIIAGPSALPTGSGRAGKRFRVNGIPRRAVDFVGQLRAVLFTADDLEIVSGPPAARRSYFDAALSQLDRGYYAALQRYTRIMQQRNATLRRIREGMAGLDELALWDDSFCREGATIIAGRQNAVRRLATLAAEAHTELAGAANETLSISYQPQLGGDEWRNLLPVSASPATVQPLFSAALAGQRRRETAAGISLVGPHRDDVSLQLNGTDLAAFGSRAQIRTAALALRLAEARLFLAESSDPPVLLLDDVISELDERRRASVLSGVSGFDQVWFTATSGAWLPPDFLVSCRTFHVASGQVTEAD